MQTHVNGCQKCDFTGWFRTGNGLVEPCECTAKANAKKLQAKIGSPIKPVTFADLRQTASVRIMTTAGRKFIENPTGYLSYTGPNGTGKSYTLMAIAGALIAKSIPTVYITAKRLVDWLKDGIGDDYSVELRIARISTIQVLCLDELAAISWTDWVTEQLTAILSNRYDEQLGTVLAMDVEPGQVLSPRLLSRIGEYPIIQTSGPDIRAGRAK